MREDRETAHRLAAYSDAVFAVIVTIMVLELKSPEEAAFSALWPLWPTAISAVVQMRRLRRDLSPAWARTVPLLAAGPWLRLAASADSCRGSWIRKPKRRLHLARNPIDVAIDSEASVIMFHDGWYYLLVTEGSCGAGANSSCNIRIGRSRKVTGPFVDSMGIEMLPDAGKLLSQPSGRS